MSEKGILLLASNFFFSNNFKPFPNDESLALTKLKAFAEDKKCNLKHELFYSFIEQRTLRKKGKMLSNSIFFFCLNVFQNFSSSIGFLKAKGFLCAMVLRHS